MRNGKKGNKNGFTLVEVVVSVFIATIISVGFLVMFTSSYTGFFMLGGRTRAVNDAQSLVEMYYTSPAGVDTSLWKQAGPTEVLDNTLLGTYSGFTHFYKVETVSRNGVSVLQVTALVFYQNNEKSVTVSSLVS
ncbi:MAG: prepilin-type N-terminal cleavage/methylation domain-containing protein [Clostridia bacterium]|nr:prepilin-type N-terminal cleavage/methylation domain-containing protein [Clostridia bacterium]